MSPGPIQLLVMELKPAFENPFDRSITVLNVVNLPNFAQELEHVLEQSVEDFAELDDLGPIISPLCDYNVHSALL